MEVLWTFSDMLATFCFTWVSKKLILMFEFSHTTAIQRTVTSYIWEMMAFSYGFIKCIDLFCCQFSITNSLLILTFLLVLRFFLFTVLQIPPSCWVSVSIYFPQTLKLVFFTRLSFCDFLPVFLTPLGHSGLWSNKLVHRLHERRDCAFVSLFLLNHSENCTLREGFIAFNYLTRIY